MSGQVYDTGSVYDFVPGRFKVVYDLGEGPDGGDIFLTLPGVGWATRVTKRDMWTVVTEIVPMVEDFGLIVPIDQPKGSDTIWRIVDQ